MDSVIGTALFETWDWLKRAGSAYSSFLYRFRLSGLRRVVVDIFDDVATFGVIIAFGLLAYALPPFSGTGDVWNRGREYAVTLTDINGEIIGRRGIRQDDAIPLDDLPQHLINAVLATEDARFYDHFGVDVIGTMRAVIHNARSDAGLQGGSSLTQQVAKNLFLSPEQTIRRKVHEAFLSVWIEARLSKDEILKLYLDRSYLGGGNFGVEAASQFYFGKSVRDIGLVESAMLAGLFKAPSKYAPTANIEATRARTNVVLYRMLDVGFISQGELLLARRQPANVIAQNINDSPNWFLDKAYTDTVALLEANKLTSEYVIEVKTTIDMKLQRAMQKIISDEIAVSGEKYHATQGAAVTMAPDGALRAIVGGNDYEVSQFNRAVDAQRQTGSAFKPFVYLAALLNGFKPEDTVVDSPVAIGGWAPRNYTGKYAGRTTLTKALAHSYNSVPVRLMVEMGRGVAGVQPHKVGIKAIVETAHKVGIRGELETWAPMVLGTSSLSLLDLTTGYATFAGGGRLATPYSVLEIRRANGDVIYNRADDAEPPPQVVPYDKIAELNSMMKEVVKSGTARQADLGFAPQAGKTGTNQGYRDAWYVGYTANSVTGVWFGNDDFTPMKRVTGGMIPAPVWKSITLVADEGMAVKSLAGVPLDDTYAPIVDTTIAQTPTDETDQAAGDIEATESGDVALVLNDMFKLFDAPKVKTKKKAVAAQKPDAQPQPAIKARQEADPNRTLLENLFGSSEKAEPPRKKKPLFSN